MTSIRNMYAKQLTFMEMLLECSEFIDKARHDATSSKGDVLDSMEMRVSFLIGKMASSPTCSSFAVFLPEPAST